MNPGKATAFSHEQSDAFFLSINKIKFKNIRQQIELYDKTLNEIFSLTDQGALSKKRCEITKALTVFVP